MANSSACCSTDADAAFAVYSACNALAFSPSASACAFLASASAVSIANILCNNPSTPPVDDVGSEKSDTVSSSENSSGPSGLSNSFSPPSPIPRPLASPPISPPRSPASDGSIVLSRSTSPPTASASLLYFTLSAL